MLPYTVTVSRAADALCGSVSENLNVNHEEDLSTWEIGEIGWFDGWFTVLCDNEENMRKRTRTIIGKIVDEDIAYMQSLTGTINISIKLEETNTSAQENSNTEENQNQEEETNSNQTPEQTPVINQEEITAMFIYVNGNKLKVTLEKNSAVESLVDELKKGDITYTADDYGNFEKVGDLPCSLPRDDRQMSVNYGDVVYYAGRSLCLYYGSNSWSFTPIGKINGYSQSELRTLICAGSGVITVKISLN